MSALPRCGVRLLALSLIGALLLSFTGLELAVHLAVAHGGQWPETGAVQPHCDHGHPHHEHAPDEAPPHDQNDHQDCGVCHLLLHIAADRPAIPASLAAPDPAKQPLRLAIAIKRLPPLRDQAQPRAPPAHA